MNIAIVDYGMGNLKSVFNAFMSLGATTIIASKPGDLENADKIVLPGVGSFGDGMRHLTEAGWIDALSSQVIDKRKPFLGICLGMQLLATEGTEHGLNKGLNWIPGTVERLEDAGKDYRIPHIGWNDVQYILQNGIYRNLITSGVFYFVHSYAFIPKNKDVVSGVCNYGRDFVASVEFDNIFATQYHPEKSHRLGMSVLKNFIEYKVTARA